MAQEGTFGAATPQLDPGLHVPPDFTFCRKIGRQVSDLYLH